jgi:(R,R)-butanediol dehydrogenase/meso-butanediol dehydrogenase/diacetyl reductase
LIEVSHCGICGTDLHVVLEGMGVRGSVGGHEYSGRIVAVGADVAGWEAGSAVVGGPRAGCGDCPPCRARRPSLCAGRRSIGMGGFQGAFADYVKVDASQLLAVPEGLGLREAALAEPLAVALHALTLAAPQPGERVLVTGAGPLGLLVIAALHARGLKDVRASEPSRLRRERAGRVGATELFEPDQLAVKPLPFDLADDPVDVVFECSGSPDAMESGLGQLDRMGRLILVGTGMRRPTFDHNRILLNELVVMGAYNYDETGMSDALRLLASGKLVVEELIEPIDVPLSGMLAALEGLERGELTRKVMIVPREVER